MIVNILLLILILLRLIIGIRLLINARQNNLGNLNWLAAHFFAFAIGLAFAPTQGNPLGGLPFSLWLFGGFGSLLAQPMLLQFNQTTFYQGRKSPRAWFWAAFLLFGTVTLYGIFISESNYNQSPWVAVYVFSQLLIWGWHGWSAYQALRGFANEQAVEDWVKSRYQLIIYYSILLVIGAMASFVRTAFAGGSALTPLGTFMGIITLVAQIASVTLQFLVWVMPEVFRQWLNRNQKIHTQERIHMQALAVLNILGSAMADGTGLEKMMCLYAIRKSIGNTINTDDAILIEEHAVKMGYNGWGELLSSREMTTSIGIAGDNVNVTDAINKAKQALNEKQSIFTMQAR